LGQGKTPEKVRGGEKAGAKGQRSKKRTTRAFRKKKEDRGQRLTVGKG
jgi:hypothetical protein